jgi:uncharacterized protein YukE
MRVSDGGGYGAITGHSYSIKTMAVAADSASEYTAPEIEQLFSYLEPPAMSEAGSAHTAASQTLASIADDLVKHVQVLNENWSGTAAQTAVGNFQQLHETAIGLAQASAQTGSVLSWLGETILPFYKNYKAPSNGVVGDLESLVGHNPQNSAAQAVMERLNNRLVQANDGLPSSVSVSLPRLGGANGSTTVSGPGSAGAGAGQAASGVSGLAGGSSGGGAVGLAGGVGAGAGVGGLSGLGRGSAGSATHLASYSPPGGGSGAGASPSGALGSGGVPAGATVGSGGPAPGGGMLPISGGGGPGSAADGPGGAGVASGEGALGEGLGSEALGSQGLVSDDMVAVAPGDSAAMGADGMIAMVPGDPGAAALGGGVADGGLGAGDAAAAGDVGVDGAAAGDAAGSGMPGFPMMGSAAGPRDMERRRQAWMAEDADVWAAEAGLAPAVIGG